MKINEIEEGKCYLYDTENTVGQYEDGINIVKVLSKHKFFFIQYVICAPYSMSLNSFNMNYLMKVSDLSLIEPMDNNPGKNILIRYPSDLPAFSDYDVQLLAKVSNEMATKFFTESDLTEQELLVLAGLLTKVKFYADVTERYRPNPGIDNG